MSFPVQFWRALADYGVKFTGLADLGAGSPPSAWLAEYNRVRSSAFGAVLITANGMEGESASGQKNFPSELLLDALHCRRFELDPTYTLPAHLADFLASKAEAAGTGRWHRVRFSA